jgi:hypothetical protein
MPEKPARPKKRSFTLFTRGDIACLDALAIMTELLRELPPNEVRANLNYLNDRFRHGLDSSDRPAAAE